MTAHLVPWLDQQLENQRHTGRTLHALATTEPPEVGQLLAQVGDYLIADADTKRRIIVEHRTEAGVCDHCFTVPAINNPWDGQEIDLCDTCTTIRLLAVPFAGEPGYQEGWRP
ncbi:DUF6221 family protein [Micromonospora sp. NPDC048935]|uniref:DUF6221 family protein n=1 Tax=Micromonospora sp. NPDC048935 TaxID=3364262 RepID=UPI00371D83EA